MRVTEAIAQAYKPYLPLKGKTVVLCTHATEATVRFAMGLQTVGAHVYYYPISFSNDGQFCTQMQNAGVVVLANDVELKNIIQDANIILEDGARISKRLYDDIEQYHFQDNLFTVEQTTNGITFFQAQHGNKLWYPVINVAEGRLKRDIENTLATPESIIVSLLSLTGQSLAQKQIMIIGYGSLGSGLAKLCRDHGSEVTIVEVDPARRLLSRTNGFTTIDPSQIEKLISDTDIIFSCTANHQGSLLNLENAVLMKDGAIICNAGSGRGEISAQLLNEGTFAKDDGVVKIHSMGDDVLCNFEKRNAQKTIRILCHGHPINLRHGGGTSKDVIDFVFASMLLIAIKTNPQTLSKQVHPVDYAVESELATYAEKAQHNHAPMLIPAEQLTTVSRNYGGLVRFGFPGDHLSRFSLARAIFQPRTKTQGHYHLTSDEAYFIESGTATIQVWDHKNPQEKTAYKVKKGDYLTVPSKHVHVVETQDEECVCLVIASPPFSFWDQFFPEGGAHG